MRDDSPAEEKMDNEIERAAKMIVAASYVICLAGAGISVESGIRTFRGPGGIWTENGEPTMNGFKVFKADPLKYWQGVIERYSKPSELSSAISKAEPNPAHIALAELEKMGVLKYLITQNIDNLHQVAGNNKIAEIHGNIKKVRCIRCNARYPRSELSLEVLPPHCPRCNGILKGDPVMFGEPIPSDVLQICKAESNKADCVLSIGTSALIYPAANFPKKVKATGGILIEVNLYETAITRYCDVSIRGKAAEMVPRLVDRIKSLIQRKTSEN